MGRVRGIGGVFFKSDKNVELREWYAKRMGIVSDGEGGAMFAWNQPDKPAGDGLTTWCIFPGSTKVFGEGACELHGELCGG